MGKPTNPIRKAFVDATPQEREEFCRKTQELLCRILRNASRKCWCSLVLEARNEQLRKDHEETRGLFADD